MNITPNRFVVGSLLAAGALHLAALVARADGALDALAVALAWLS